MSNHTNHTWTAPIVASLEATMPGGGKVRITAPPAYTPADAKRNLEQTEREYDQWGGWSGPG